MRRIHLFRWWKHTQLDIEWRGGFLSLGLVPARHVEADRLLVAGRDTDASKSPRHDAVIALFDVPEKGAA